MASSSRRGICFEESVRVSPVAPGRVRGRNVLNRPLHGLFCSLARLFRGFKRAFGPLHPWLRLRAPVSRALTAQTLTGCHVFCTFLPGLERAFASSLVAPGRARCRNVLNRPLHGLFCSLARLFRGFKRAFGPLHPWLRLRRPFHGLQRHRRSPGAMFSADFFQDLEPAFRPLQPELFAVRRTRFTGFNGADGQRHGRWRRLSRAVAFSARLPTSLRDCSPVHARPFAVRRTCFRPM